MFTPGSRACGYKTASGRDKWPSRDPIGERAGINLYAFVSNDPQGGVDAFGWFMRKPDFINCLGYASGAGAAIQPERGESLKTVAEKLGFKCHGPTTEKCKSTCDNDTMGIYVYKYSDNIDPWNDRNASFA